MLQLVIKRLLISLPTLIALTFAVFVLVKAVPGDPAMLMLGERASAKELAHVREELGLNRPWYVQYGRFLGDLVLHGDLGRSIKSNEQISHILANKFPATAELAIAAMIFAILIGIPTGLLSSIWPGTFLDFLSMTIAVAGVSMPIFWLALMLIWFFGLQLGWLPLSGRLGIEFSYEPWSGLLLLDSIRAGDWDMLVDALRHLLLPAIALGTIPMAIIARMTRSSMLEVLKQDYVRTARAKGLGLRAVVLKHALKNAGIPILTILGLQFGLLLGGAIITETVFSWPGIGSWLLECVSSRDFPALQGGVLLVASAFVLVNLVVDLLYRTLDPRMRIS